MRLHSILVIASSILVPLSVVAHPSRALADAAPLAKVLVASDDAVRVDASGNEQSLKRGERLAEGDLVASGSGGVQILFMDGATVALDSASSLRIERYRRRTANGEAAAWLRLLTGALRAISGSIAKDSPDAYRMSTSVAVIGVRGTAYSVFYRSENSVEGAVDEGVISVCNVAGCLDVSAGQGFLVRAQRTPSLVRNYRESDLRTADPEDAAQETGKNRRRGDGAEVRRERSPAHSGTTGNVNSTGGAHSGVGNGGMAPNPTNPGMPASELLEKPGTGKPPGVGPPAR